MTELTFTPTDAARWVHAPHGGSDKYSRGVLGFVIGSPQYPGAALLGIDAALHTGVGMVRFVGPASVSEAVLQHRPEVVLGDARAQAWVVGSGMDSRDSVAMMSAAVVLDESRPAIVDAGALSLLSRHARGLVIATPHAGELAQLLGVTRVAVESEPAQFAELAARFLGVTVVLKGASTHIAGEGGTLRLDSATSWLAIAGAGDVLAGIMGALLASNCAHHDVTEDQLVSIAATAVFIHSEAASRASAGGPFVLADLVACVPAVVAELTNRTRS